MNLLSFPICSLINYLYIFSYNIFISILSVLEFQLTILLPLDLELYSKPMDYQLRKQILSKVIFLRIYMVQNITILEYLMCKHISF